MSASSISATVSDSLPATSTWPRSPFEPAGGTLTFDRLSVDPATFARHGERLAIGLGSIPLQVTTAPSASQTPLAVASDHDLGEEGYALGISSSGVELCAGGPAGIGYGALALRQLAGPDAERVSWPGPWQLPLGKVSDRPAFSWRGALFDVSRYFFTKAEVLRFIDHMAAHRLNRLHLHLSDDQGWRVESSAYPALHELGSWRPRTQVGFEVRRLQQGGPIQWDNTPHGGYYTQADLQEMTRYAALRGVVIVPELDLPGHSSPLLAAIPELRVPGVVPPEGFEVAASWGVHPAICSPLPGAMEILATLIGEVADCIESPYFHIGGDECVTGWWERSVAVSEYRKKVGAADCRALQHRVTQELISDVEQLGRRAVVWDEAATHGQVPQSTIVMVWRARKLGPWAAESGYDVVLTPSYPAYINAAESLMKCEPLAHRAPLSCADVAAWEPLAGVADDVRHHILGVQASLWTEYVPNYLAAEYLAYPRLSLVADIAWRGQSSQVGPEFEAHLNRLVARGINFRPPAGPHPWQQGGTGQRACDVIEPFLEPDEDLDALLAEEPVATGVE